MKVFVCVGTVRSKKYQDAIEEVYLVKDDLGATCFENKEKANNAINYDRTMFSLKPEMKDCTVSYSIVEV
jgi:hypothetical protein